MDESPFALLSPELGNHIYDLCVTSDVPLSISGYVLIHYLGCRLYTSQPPITRVCREMRGECLLMFYASNNFIINIPSDVVNISPFDNIGPQTDIKTTIAQAVKWLNKTPTNCHSAVKRLSLDAEVDICDLADYVEDNGKAWRKLIKCLGKKGYKGSRLMSSVLISSESSEPVYTEEDHAEAREAFRGFGLTVDRVWD